MTHQHYIAQRNTMIVNLRIAREMILAPSYDRKAVDSLLNAARRIQKSLGMSEQDFEACLTMVTRRG